MSGLIATPLLWLAVTLAVFEAADILSRRSGRHPLCHPVLLATPVLIGVLLATKTPYATYAEATQVLGFLLGPAVVGLAVPIWAQRATIRRLAKPLTCALLAGAATAIVSAVGIVWLFGAPAEIIASIAPRAMTTPVGMAVASQLGHTGSGGGDRADVRSDRGDDGDAAVEPAEDQGLSGAGLCGRGVGARIRRGAGVSGGSDGGRLRQSGHGAERRGDGDHPVHRGQPDLRPLP